MESGKKNRIRGGETIKSGFSLIPSTRVRITNINTNISASHC